jgi:PAS domain S-box-containing protein
MAVRRGAYLAVDAPLVAPLRSFTVGSTRQAVLDVEGGRRITASSERPDAVRTKRRPLRFSAHLVWLVLASALPFVVLAVGLSVSFAIDQRRQTLEEMAETTRALQRAVDREIELAEAILRALRRTRSVGEAVAAGPRGGVEARAAFHATASALVAEGRRTVHNISLHDAATGEQIVNTLRPLDAPLPSLEEVRVPEARVEDDPQALVRAVFNQIITDRRLFITDLYHGPAAGMFLVSVMLPVEQDGEVIAILAANLLPSALGQVLREQTPPIGYVSSVVDRDGIIIARTREPERFVGTKGGKGLLTFVADSALREVTERATAADGAEVYGAYRRLSTAPWTVAYGAPVAAVDAPIRRLVLIMGGAGSLALGFFVGVSFWQAFRLTREMGELALDAERIGRGEPLPDRSDRVLEVAGVRGALRAGVASLAAAEERMRLAVEGSGMATWDIDVRRHEVAWAGHFLEMLGLPRDHRGPLPLKAWLDRVHPDDLHALEAQWKTSSQEGTRFHNVYRIARADDGALRWLESYGAHLRDGGQHRLIGVTFDVTDRHQAEEQRQLLMREVDHRAKNALAVVQSVVRLTRASDPASYAAAVEGRVRALARAHDLLARDRWAGASLVEVAGQELAAQIVNGQVTTVGPALLLVPEAVQPLSMVLYELATNAAKYGAFSAPEGHVRLAWRLGAGEEPLRLEWIERGGPHALVPTETGFGTRLIELTVKGQLGGTVEFDWAGKGLSCMMTVPRRLVGGIDISPAAAAGSSTDQEANPADLEGRRVLVVEDEAIIGAELVQSLSRAGCRALGPFATVEAANAALSEERPVDAAVLDVNLRQSDSLPLARGLLAAGVPVVVVTGYSVLPAAWANEKGLGTVLHKPVDPNELIAALGHALRQQRAA